MHRRGSGQRGGNGECCRTLQHDHPTWAMRSSLDEIPVQGDLPQLSHVLSFPSCPWSTALAEGMVSLAGCPIRTLWEMGEDRELGRSSLAVRMSGDQDGSDQAEGMGWLGGVEAGAV